MVSINNIFNRIVILDLEYSINHRVQSIVSCSMFQRSKFITESCFESTTHLFFWFVEVCELIGGICYVSLLDNELFLAHQ